MPNHVSVGMTITGDKDEITAFAEKHFADDLLNLSSFVPMPIILEGTRSPNDEPRNVTELELARWKKETATRIEETGYDNWYDWKIGNWGTKWNTYEGTLSIADGEITSTYQTAWNLPWGIFENIAERYPTLHVEIMCHEEGGFFAGEVTIDDGVIDDSKLVHNDQKHWEAFGEEHFYKMKPPINT